MENNGKQGKLIAELAALLKNHDVMIKNQELTIAELKASHREHDVMIKNQEITIAEMKATTKAVLSLLSGHAEEMRDNKRWLRRHEASIQTHWKAISSLRK